MAGLVQACPGHPDSLALCRLDRDRRDKPGDDEMAPTGFAPVTCGGLIPHRHADPFDLPLELNT
jgi:hypothetical protein